ncbi:TonB-dependent receptor [Leptothermofonsia sichuanensis E412]|uniref:TonB-dependent receptor n=1 Tax=Leptothermofonsia sichuanensis TaxID=2917832 RepID=UPI001CA639C9|nr:TonB-dependent receptor [Leptothermofonsia sichuanensis]QZZ20577.1 TonB-dependent receptor [Leptothermofonsia sichuanensis E412]
MSRWYPVVALRWVVGGLALLPLPGQAMPGASILLKPGETVITAQESPSPVPSPAPTLPVQADELDEDEEELIIIERILRQPVSTPGRGEATLRDSTRPTYVINREEIEQRGARTVREALRFLPGILGDGTVGSQVNSLSGQFIRGSNTGQVLILLDGRPVNNLGGGGFDLSEFTTDTIERIEVLPGGGSTLYGSDAIGGVINIITRRPSNRPFSVTAKASFGSYGYDDQTLQVSGTVNPVSYLLSYNRIQADYRYKFSIPEAGFRGELKNADTLYNNLNARLEVKLSDRTNLSFNTFYLPKEQGVPGGVPVPFPIFGQGFFNSLTDSNRKYTDQVLSDVTLRTQLGAGNDSILTARLYLDFLNTRFDNRTAFADTLSVVRGQAVLRRTPQIQQRFQTQQRSLGVQVQHNWKLAPNQTVIYGFDYRSTNVENLTQNLVTDVVRLNYDDRIGQGAVFAQYAIDILPQFTVSAGLRQDFSTLTNGSALSPSVGTKLLLGDTTLRANYIRNFRTPTLANLFNANPTNIGNPDLKPERGNSFDIGIDQKIGNFALLRLTYFNNTISDLIAFQRIAPPVNGISGTWQNLGKVRTQGLEAALNVQLVPNVFAFVGYTLNDPKILESVNPNEAGRELRFAGADKLNLGIWYENRSGWYAGLLMNSLSSYPTNNLNTEFLSGYTTFDFRLRVPMTRQLMLNFSVDNIFDQRYQVFAGFPDGGRMFQGGIRYEF